MNLLCPQNYIPSNISTSMDQIEISLKAAPAQLQKVYRLKHNCDTIIKFAGKQFLAHKFVLDKTSLLFLKGLIAKHGDKWFLQIGLKAKTQLFTKILSCMYGHSTTVKRCDLQQAYQICKILQITDLTRLFESDMLSHFDQYDIFPLLKLATNEHITQIIETCYDQLDIEMYEPMRYNKSGLFLCDIELFKSVVKRHNFKKLGNDKFGLSYGQIDQLIEEYCFVNGLNKQQKYKLQQEIQDKQNLRYYVSLNQVFRKHTTPRRTKSTSQIFSRNTLTLPRQKQQDRNSYQFLKENRRLSPCPNISNTFQRSNDSSDCNQHQTSNSHIGVLTHFVCKSQSSDDNKKTYSNNSTIDQNKSQQRIRPRKQSNGSSQTISDPKILIKIMQIAQNQKSLKQYQTDMKNRAQIMLNKLKQSIQKNKNKSILIHKMESSIQQMNAQISCNQSKLLQLSKTIQNVQAIREKKQAQQKFDKLFEASIALDLTLSQQIGNKQLIKNCKK